MTEAIQLNVITKKIVKELSHFIDAASFTKIINKLTDYAEVIPDGKLSGIINYNFKLNSAQTNSVINLLLETHALSRVYNLALKGSRDLETEYISNLISDISSVFTLSSYMSLRNMIENRLSHQIQQYNMNMSKSNTTMAMPLNELKGHVKTYNNLSDNLVSVSTKAQHGVIAASLHDAYAIILARPDWWDDRTYMKYFFNEADSSREYHLIFTKNSAPSYQDIEYNIKKVIVELGEIAIEADKKSSKYSDSIIDDEPIKDSRQNAAVSFYDKMMGTPFGRQYGQRIDRIIQEIFDTKHTVAEDNEEFKKTVTALFSAYQQNTEGLSSSQLQNSISKTALQLIHSQMSVKTFAEQFVHTNKNISFSNFYTEEIKYLVNSFITDFYSIFFEIHFFSVFRIIKSIELKKFACAFIIKRIYILAGESMTTFGYFFIKAIGKSGRIKTDS